MACMISTWFCQFDMYDMNGLFVSWQLNRKLMIVAARGEFSLFNEKKFFFFFFFFFGGQAGCPTQALPIP